MSIARGWCEKCGRGIDGILGSICSECISRGEGTPGIIKDPKQVEKEKLERARAMKLISKTTVKPYKSNDDIKREAKEEAIAEIMAKIASGEIKIPVKTDEFGREQGIKNKQKETK
jgi:NADPH:quinone reductase-like Zn-dependent oxidoreductase